MCIKLTQYSLLVAVAAIVCGFHSYRDVNVVVEDAQRSTPIKDAIVRVACQYKT
jgi:hypothetical protein